MNLGSLDTEGHFASGSCFRSRIDACGHVSAIDGEVQEYLCAEQLIDLDLCLDRGVALCDKLRIIIQVLRTDPEDNRLSDISAIHNLLRLLNRKMNLSCCAKVKIAVRKNFCIKEVHLRRSDESCREQVRRLVVQILRRIDLLHNTILHDDDSGTKGHSLRLVMRDIDDGCTQSLMQLGDLGSHLDTKLCIQVGERLIHQEDLRVTDNCTSHCDTLSLSAGKSLRLSVKQLLKVKDLCSISDLSVDLILRHLSQLQRECHVVINGHMRIQSIALEDHCDITILRLDIVHDLAVDLQRTGRDFLKPCNHTKRRRLSASGWSDEDDKFLVGDIKIKILHSLEPVRINLVDMLK